MKNSSLITFLIILISVNSLCAQTEGSEEPPFDYFSELASDCGTDQVEGGNFPYFPVDNDTLKILVVFAKYPNDTWDNGYATPDPECVTRYWHYATLGNNLPDWAPSIIKDSTTNIGSTNLTAMSRDASLGKFLLIGNVYPSLYVLSQNSTSYPNIGYATKEILEGINQNVNYGDYDKFDPTDIDNDNNKREPDGVVDFVLIVFRFFLGTETATGTGIAHLGGSSHSFAGSSFITLDNKKIYATYPSGGVGFGSGVISTQLTPWGYNIHFHELGHYLWGPHRDLMGWFNSMNRFGHSFPAGEEREDVNWGTKLTPTQNTSYALSDYANSGQYISFSKGGSTYYIENRRRINYHFTNSWYYWANIPSSIMEPDSALFIYSRNTFYKPEPAEGRWDWQKINNRYAVVQYQVNPQPLYKFFYDKPSKILGESPMDLINKPAYDISIGQNISSAVSHSEVLGGGHTFFDIGYNQVYSPWSNPGVNITQASDSFAVEITGKDVNGNLLVDVYFNNLTQTTPAKPQLLKLSKQYSGDIFNPRLNWFKNKEPDLQKYKIYRGVISTPGVDPSYIYIGETTDSVFIDEAIDLYEKGSGSGICSYLLRNYVYRVTAFDNTNKESVKSERDSISGYIDPCAPEEMPYFNGETELNYKLSQNYPNPFNPKTNISYSIPESSVVSLKIYDALGKQVIILVSGFKQPGIYTIQFDGSKLPSGIYYYKLRANNFTQIRKMLLIK